MLEHLEDYKGTTLLLSSYVSFCVFIQDAWPDQYTTEVGIKKWVRLAFQS